MTDQTWREETTDRLTRLETKFDDLAKMLRGNGREGICSRHDARIKVLELESARAHGMAAIIATIAASFVSIGVYLATKFLHAK
jgi:hypothetical protein